VYYRSDVRARVEDKIDDMKDSFYEELEHLFDKVCKYHIKFVKEISL
jgi:hypothetical protein